MKRLLTIGHSYVVALNRRLAHEMAVQGRGRWDVTAVAPRRYAGDLRTIQLEAMPEEACRLAPSDVHLDSMPHLMFYGGGLRAALRERWDVVHCWEEPYTASGWQIARRTPRGARFVFATFQNIVKRYPPPLAWFERGVVSRADGWIAFGRTAHDAHAPRQGYRSLPSRIIPPGVEIDRFKPDAERRARVRAELGWDDAAPIVGFLGRFTVPKGTTVLTAALKALTVPWRALFVGGGGQLDALQAFADAHPGQVRIVTGTSHDDVADYLNAMDLLCAPSQTTRAWREQFGRMVIEAMACGVPVAASRSGEIPHVVADAGVLLPEADVDAWVNALQALLTDGASRRDYARRGLARVRERFAWDIVARDHLQFFEELTA